MATNWKQKLASDRSPASRCAALILVVFVVAAFICVPFVIWWGAFSVWNVLVMNAGWTGAVVPVNANVVACAVVLTWFLRWFICRKS